MADYVQIAGRPCAACGERISTEREGRACPNCGAVTHRKCADGHTCEAKAATPAAAAPAAQRRSAWPYVGAVLGVMVAAGVKPVIDHWRDGELVRERASRDLRCSPEHVTITYAHEHVRATGCHDLAEYDIVCHPLSRESCLLMTTIPSAVVDEGIERSLGLRPR